ncbi:unnamed protein product [Prunus brigantina]
MDGIVGMCLHHRSKGVHALKSVKEINAQAIEDPSLAREVSGQSVHDGQVIGKYSIFRIWSCLLEMTKMMMMIRQNQRLLRPLLPERKERRLLQPPKKRVAGEYVATEGIAAAPSNTSGTDEDLREAFEEVEQEKEMEELEEAADGPQEKAKARRERGKSLEIPAEVIARKHCLGSKQRGTEQEGRWRADRFELALFEDFRPVPVSKPSVFSGGKTRSIPRRSCGYGNQPREASHCCFVSVPSSVFPLALSILHKANLNSLYRCLSIRPGFSCYGFFCRSELAEFEAMDPGRPVDRLEKLSSTPGTAKSRAVREAIERLKIWQSTELDEGQEAIDHR